MNALSSRSLPLPVRTPRATALVGVVSLVAMALTACGAAAPESDSEARDVPGEVIVLDAPEEATPDAGASETDAPNLPSCEVIERQVGTGLETLELAAEELHIAEHAMDSTRKSCTWLTEMYEDLRNADATTLMDAVHTGALTMSIEIGPRPLSAEDAAAGGFLFHDLRAERAGGYVFSPEDTDLSDPLGMMGITVTVDDITVTWGGGTYFDGQGDQIAEMFDKDWGVDAAVTVHRLIGD